MDSLTVRGTCTDLEKEYFRLTSAPDPCTVRPEPVLTQSLSHLKRKWKEGGTEYLWICSQLKAVRQDLTVQRIKNALAVEVYETHARIALEEGDLNEYNQCQTQLKELYAELGEEIASSEMEFVAYRIMYYLYLQGNKKYEEGSSDMLKILGTLSPRAWEDEAVQHALELRSVMALGDYHGFFQLYRRAPNMGQCIMDHFVEKMRLQALRVIVKAYKPSIGTEFVARELAFDSADECVSFLASVGVVLADDGAMMNTKDTTTIHPPEPDEEDEKKGSLL